MSGNSGHDRRGLFGDIIHYDEHGNKTGVSKPNFWGGYNDYDSAGHKTGSSMRNFTGGFNHYDNNGHKTGRSDPALLGGMNHYDAEGHKIGHSDPSLIGGWDYRKEQMMRNTAIGSFMEDTSSDCRNHTESSVNLHNNISQSLEVTKVETGDEAVSNHHIKASSPILGWVILIISILVFILLFAIDF